MIPERAIDTTGVMLWNWYECDLMVQAFVATKINTFDDVAVPTGSTISAYQANYNGNYVIGSDRNSTSPAFT